MVLRLSAALAAVVCVSLKGVHSTPNKMDKNTL